MSFIGKMAGKAALKITENAAMRGVVNHMDKNYSVGAIEKKIVSCHKLFVREKVVALTKKFYRN